MNNLKELMKNTDKIKYTKKDKDRILRESISKLSKEQYLVICMEEISELTEVISNNICKKTDYIHTAEELVDVIYVSKAMQIIFDIKNKDLYKIKKKHDNKNVAISSISTLSKCQQNISKFLRGKRPAEKMVNTVSALNDTVDTLIKLFNIKKKDMNKIELLKYHRQEIRIKNNDIK